MRTIDITRPETVGVDVTLTYQSFYTSTLDFNTPCAGMQETPPYVEGEEYRVIRDGQTVLVGPVTSCERQMDATSASYYWAVTISDRWHWLESCMYVSDNALHGIAAPTSIIKGRAKDGSEDIDTSQETPTMAMTDALQLVLANNVRLQSTWRIEVADGAQIIPFEADVSKHGDLLRAIQKWRPGLTSRWDYADPEHPVLVISDHGEVVTLDRSDLIQDVTLRPRPDLIPPAVAILGTSRTGDGSMAYTQSVWPEGRTDLLKQPYAMMVTVDLPEGTKVTIPEDDPNLGTSDTTQSGDDATGQIVDNNRELVAYLETWAKYNTARMIVRGNQLPDPTNKDAWIAWWRDHVPQLEGLTITIEELVTEEAIDSQASDIGGYVKAQHPYEFVSGQHNGNTALHWSEVQVKQVIVHKGKPADKIASMFPQARSDGNYQGEFCGKFYTIDRHYYSYALDSDSTPLGTEPGMDNDPIPDVPSSTGDARETPKETAEPCYDGLAKAAWEAAQKLEYEGTVGVVRGRLLMPGMRLNITGSVAEYASMETTIQTVRLDAASGKVTLTVGPPEHLGIQSLVERARSLCRQAKEASPIANEINLMVKQDSESSETPAPGPGGTVSNGLYYPPRKRPDAPMLSPKFELSISAGSVSWEGGFAIRNVYNNKGGVDKLQYHKGTVLGPKNEMAVGAAEWNDLGATSGEIYCNVEIDKQGKITSASVSFNKGTFTQPKPFSEGIKGKSGTKYTPSETPFDGEGGSFSVHLASVKNNNISMHHLGVISIPIMPEYVLFEIKDFVEDSSAGDDVSLIEERKDRYALLKRLTPGQWVKFGKVGSQADPPRGFLKINAKQVKVVDVSIADGVTVGGESLIASGVSDPDDEANWTETFFIRQFREMTNDEYASYEAEGQECHGLPRCRIRIKPDKTGKIIAIGAWWSTFADAP